MRKRTVIVNDKMQKRLSLRADRAGRPRLRSGVQAGTDAARRCFGSACSAANT